MGALWFGEVNHQPERPVQNPLEYIEEFKGLIEQEEQEAKKAEAATPEFIQEIENSIYRSSVDGKIHHLTDKNWMYYIFSGKKENYKASAEEARATLEGFGKAAMEAGDYSTHNLVQEVLRELE